MKQKKYRAKKSYNDLKPEESLLGLGCPHKHNKLLGGGWILIDNPPEELAKHLTTVKKKEEVENATD